MQSSVGPKTLHNESMPMSQHVVTILDITGIQAYIFGSNKLRDNIGASQLIEWATKKWLYETLNQAGGAQITPHSDDSFSTPAIDDEKVQAELIYAGGGNAIILFANMERAKFWATAYSRHLLQHAPRLGFAIVHSPPFAWKPESNDLIQIIDDLKNNALLTTKQTAQTSVPLLGLGVTASCQSTGLPAVEYHKEASTYRPVSSEVKAKLTHDTQQYADKRFQKMFEPFAQLELKLPYDFDDLVGGEGQSRDQGYIAVVHADGNAMGQVFQQIGKRGLTNRVYIQEIRTLSAQVQQAGMQALAHALGGLIGPDARLISPFQHRQYFPVRPIVYGGDDVTFVCDGQLGLALAARYLDSFEQTTEDTIGHRLTACAGIAIVKAHYPFARAYDLSEELCRHAKGWARRSCSAMDWHIATSGLLGDLDTIREREYTVRYGKLTMRPISLHVQHNEWRNWRDFRTMLHTFKNSEEWSGKRNKVMRLREVLREGRDRTSQFLKLYRLNSLPPYAHAPTDLAEKGWISSDNEPICGYFDVIEALDFFSLLAGEEL